MQHNICYINIDQGSQTTFSCRYNAIKLVQSVHASLAALSKVIRGTQLLTNDVQNLAAALLMHEVWKIKIILSHRAQLLLNPKTLLCFYWLAVSGMENPPGLCRLM